ncbi:MAG: hypothetical protein HQK84_04305 [Nitrospinae bacterium]|nr:hypothetical protein [Nitrospinota bacterium]
MVDFYDASNPIEIAEGVFHLGVQDQNNSFSNVPYLIVDGDEAAFIDPGSMKDDFFATVLRKVHAVVNPRKIKHLIVQHQDPDLCAALPFYEKISAPDVQISCPLEAKVLMQHYGTKHSVHPLDDGDSITFGNGRSLVFSMTPYCHFVGAMVTYDTKTKTVFSSDAFGGFTSSNDLYAGEDYPTQLSTFLGQYLGSKKALEYALKRLEKLNETNGINLICPQHGCIIKKEQIPMYLQAAHDLHVGGEVDALAQKHGIQLD